MRLLRHDLSDQLEDFSIRFITSIPVLKSTIHAFCFVLTLGLQAQDVSTATFVQEVDILNTVSSPSGMAFNSDGTKLFVGGTGGIEGVGEAIYAFDLSTPYDISTATYNNEALSLQTTDFQIGVRDMVFKPDGSMLFIIGSKLNLSDFSSEEGIFAYDLTPNFNLSSDGSTPDAEYLVTAQEGFTSGIDFNNDGTKVYFVGKNNDKVIERTLSTAYDISTIDISTVNEKDISSELDRPESLRFNQDGSIMFVLETDVTAETVKVFSYDLSTLFDVSSASHTGSNDLTVSYADIRPAAMTFGNNDSKFYLAGIDATGAPVREYDVVIDLDPPTVAITSGESDPTNSSPFQVSITFSEEVSGFEVGDISVGNGSASNLQTSDDITFTVDITPTADGTVTVDINASVVQDLAGNDNTVATQFSIVSDRTAPDVLFTEVPEYINSDSQFSATFVFGADVSGFNIADINLTNASASNLQATLKEAFGVTVEEFTVDITPDGSGNDITISIPADVAQDAAGNNNTASTTAEILYDATLPTLTISSSANNPTNLESITLTFTFSESVSGFSSSAITVTNGTISELVESTVNQVFTTTLSLDVEEEVTVNVAANAANDKAGNGNESATFSILYDATGPTPVVTLENTITNTSPIPVTIDFGEPVVGFESSDLSLSGATAATATTTDNTTFSVELTAEPSGIDSIQIEINLEAAKVTDQAGNTNMDAETKNIIYDTKPPVPTLSTLRGFESEVGHFHDGSKFTVLVSMNELIENFTSDDITIDGGEISNFSVSSLSPRLYSFDVTPTIENDITITIAAGVMNDQAGNNNAVGDMLEVIYDATAPTITSIVITEGNVTNKDEINVVIIFSEVVSGFLLADLEVSNGSASLITTADNQSYNALISTSASEEGEVTVTVKDQSVEDLAGNQLDGAESVSTVYDTTVPTLEVQNAPTAVNSTSPFTLTLQFSEPITTLTESNIDITNATTAFEETDADTYSLTVTPDDEGDVTLMVSNYQDLAGNQGVSTEKLIVFDNVAPTVEILNAPTSITTRETFTITVAFSEEVSGFEVADMTVGLGSATNVTQGSSVSQFTVDITPDIDIAADDILSISIAADVVQDNAGNGNIESENVNISFDKRYSGGSGTEDDPYLIGSEEDLRALSANHTDWARHFKQTTNIEMSDEPFLPIGRVIDGEQEPNKFFSGSYDGGSHIISHLNLAKSPIDRAIRGMGFIGRSGGSSIRNLGLVDVYHGPLVIGNLEIITLGMVAIVDNATSTTLEEVFIHFRSGEISTAYFGGLVGSVNGIAHEDRTKLTINNSYVTGDVVFSVLQQGLFYGSIIGLVGHETDVAINNSYSSLFTHLSNEDGNTVEGGLIGDLIGTTSSIRISHSFWDSDIHNVAVTVGQGGTGDEGGVGLTSEEMRNLTTYTNAGWDLKGETTNGSENIWAYYFYYPVLSWYDDNAQPFTVSGRAVDKDSAVFRDGRVKAQTFFAEPITVPLGDDGSFSINLDKGLYSLSVVPNNGNEYLTTFYGDTKRSDRSLSVLHDESNIRIQMIAKSQENQLDGNGRLSGRVVSSEDDAGERIVQGRILEGDPVEGVTVFLVRTSDEEILASVVTDENGDFEITGIPAGEYQLLLDVAGIDVNLEGSTFTMDEEGSDLAISAAVSEEGVSFAIEEVLAIKDEIVMEIFPNPVREKLTVQVEGEAIIKILSLSGQLIKERSFAKEITVDVQDLEGGVHLIEVSNKNGRSVRKLIKD